MKYHVFLTPVHVVEIDCDEHYQVSGVQVFAKGDQIIAEFSQCIGWLELVPGVVNSHKASVTQLQVVSSNNPPAPAATT